jgi:hypothetical protein
VRRGCLRCRRSDQQHRHEGDQEGARGHCGLYKN